MWTPSLNSMLPIFSIAIVIMNGYWTHLWQQWQRHKKCHCRRSVNELLGWKIQNTSRTVPMRSTGFEFFFELNVNLILTGCSNNIIIWYFFSILKVLMISVIRLCFYGFLISKFWQCHITYDRDMSILHGESHSSEDIHFSSELPSNTELLCFVVQNMH